MMKGYKTVGGREIDWMSVGLTNKKKADSLIVKLPL
jgi:hypothetical protein